MPELPKSSTTDLKTLLKIDNDVVIMSFLRRTIEQHGTTLFNHSKVWLEFALSVSNEESADRQYYLYADFCFLVDRVLDHNIIDVNYLFALKQLVKKSGRIIEFTILLNGLSDYNQSDYWLSNNMIFLVFFHALQLDQGRFSHHAFKTLYTLLGHKVCLLNDAQLSKLSSLASLNGRMRCYAVLKSFYKIMCSDLSVIEPYYPDEDKQLPVNMDSLSPSVLTDSLWSSSGDTWDMDDDAMVCEELAP